MWSWIKGKLGLILKLVVYVRRLITSLVDLKCEFYNAAAGYITWEQFFKQIVPTLKYHLSGEFEKKVEEIMKEEHVGL